MNKQERTTTNMLYDEIMKIVTLAGELMLQAQDEELTVFDKEGTANFVTKHDKEIQFYLIQNLNCGRELCRDDLFLNQVVCNGHGQPSFTGSLCLRIKI